MKSLVSLLFLLVGIPLYSQDLAVSGISDELKKDASVIVRNSTTEFEILSVGKALETHHLELTILNEKGKREAQQYVPYSDLEKIVSVNGELYDKQGKRIKKIKNNDMGDVSASGSNMYTDNRIKVLDFSYPNYPYSIVMDYKVAHDGLMFYPSWFPQDNFSTSVVAAKFRVITPIAIGLNYYEQHLEGVVSTEGDKMIYEWEVDNLAAFEAEPYSPPNRELVPMVMITPKEFEIEGYSGSMSSWQSIGAYENKLLDGKQKIPDDLKLKVDSEIAGLDNKYLKAKAIYEFVQNSTRYVSIQLGIGGWEPYDVNYVYENGYGDCKALTNYTMALLNYAGIPSIYTTVYAGRGVPDIITEFPNARFNHVFLAVPMDKDTVWLECTSQKNPFGYLGSFTSDRHVLMTTREGGKLVKTPTYNENQNTQIRRVEIELTKTGDARTKIQTTYKGLQYENVDHQVYNSSDEQKKWLLKNIGMKKVNLEGYTYKHEPDIIPSITESIELTSTGYASITGKHLFFNVNPLNRSSYVPKRVDSRRSEVFVRTAYTDIDSVFFKIPEGYHIEHLPESAEVKTKFGEYKTNYQRTDDGILYVRKNVRWKGSYAPESYNEFRNMLKEISRIDRTKIVLAGST